MLNDFRPTLQMLQLVGELDEFKGAWRSLKTISPERLAALKHVATIESIGSSTRIEGASLTDDQVEVLLGGLKTQSFVSRDQQEVAGYAGLMETIFENWESIPVNENHIKQLHGILLKHSDKDDRHRGNYKTVTNHVQAIGPDGRSLGIVFETASPFDTPYRMTALVEWTASSLEKKMLHPLLVIAAFVVEFLAIHPFQDGNGRLSRALTTLLLLRSGYLYVPYSSLESVIEANKEGYYLALRRTQQSFKEQSPNWEPWILFFLQAMQRQKEHLQQRIAKEQSLEGGLPTLAIKILELIGLKGSAQMSDLEEQLNESRSTMKLRVNELIKRGQLKRHGQGPATWYTLTESTITPQIFNAIGTYDKQRCTRCGEYFLPVKREQEICTRCVLHLKFVDS